MSGTECSRDGCTEPIAAHVSAIDSGGRPVQLIVRPPVDRPTGNLVCLHHAHVALDWLLMRDAAEAGR